MAKKRKSRGQSDRPSRPAQDATLNDSEDDFVAGRDKILLDEEPAAKRRRKLEEAEAELMPSDEEIYADQDLSEDEDDGDVAESDVEAPAVGEDDDEEDERYWGDSRADYYGADDIEEEQDALDEETEARRLQQKQLQGMTEADFGFDESEWVQADEEDAGTSVVEKLPPVPIPEGATSADRLQLLQTRYPEFEPLAKDLLDCHDEHTSLQSEIRTQNLHKSSAAQNRLRAISAYMAAIALYMAILTSPKDGMALPPAEMRRHPIMTSLLRSRELWEASKELENDGEGSVEEAMSQQTDVDRQPIPNGISLPANVPKKHIRSDPAANAAAIRATKSDKNEKQPSTVNGAMTTDQVAKKKSKSRKAKHTTIDDLLVQSAPTGEDESDFGDEGPLTAEEAAEKARKKKSLRFYTSQIAQKAGKRAAASRHAGGDDDLPYKERIRDRQDRLKREAENRISTQGPAETFSDGDYDENDLATKMNNDANDYYSTLVNAGAQKKANKAARSQAHALAAAQGAQVYEEETVGPDGKRKITYAIEKNKGLQPRRKKEVRNPRVKKKLKFEEKKKKLASMRPVYKGNMAAKYAGEQSGIKTNLIKSVKL